VKAAAIRAYLGAIQAPAPIAKRVNQLIAMYDGLLGVELTAVFLSDEMDDEGSRTFPSLWLFTEHAAFEAKVADVLGEEFDGTTLDGRVFQWVARTNSFDMKSASSASRMGLEVWFSDDLWGNLRATGRNCEYLVRVLKVQISPRVR
jgi:hypothetical protein